MAKQISMIQAPNTIGDATLLASLCGQRSFLFLAKRASGGYLTGMATAETVAQGEWFGGQYSLSLIGGVESFSKRSAAFIDAIAAFDLASEGDTA